MSKSILRPALWGLICAALPLTAAAQETVAIVGGKLVPVKGETIEDATILIKGGRIEAIGPRAELEPPYDAVVIDGKDRVLFPGMVVAHAQSGLDRANESLPLMPYLDAGDAINPGSYVFEDYLRDGVTTVHVIQANDCVVGGTGRAIRPIGLSIDNMTMASQTALKISVSARGGWDRIRQRAALREAFLELDDYLDRLAEKRYAEEQEKQDEKVRVPVEEARKLGRELIRDEDLDKQHKNLYLLTRGRLPAFVYCERAQDVPFAIGMARELGFLKNTVFLLGGEAYKAADLLQASGRPVILPEDLVHTERNRVTNREEDTFVPAVFAKAGVPFALQSNMGASFAERFLWYQAARCVREGISRQTALEAITLTPARICGLADKVGSLEQGKLANVLLLTGDPLSAMTKVDRVVIEGQLVYERDKDVRLKNLLSGEGPAPTAPSEGDPHPHDDEEPEDIR